MAIRICRFKDARDAVRIGATQDGSTILDLTSAGVTQLGSVLESKDGIGRIRDLIQGPLPQVSVAETRLCTPLERQELWAAGGTYLRSKKARMEESDRSEE